MLIAYENMYNMYINFEYYQKLVLCLSPHLIYLPDTCHFCCAAVQDKITFKTYKLKRYTGPGSFFTVANPTCRPNKCALACLDHGSACRAVGMSKENEECACHLYDKTFSSNYDKVIDDPNWDLIVYHYHVI